MARSVFASFHYDRDNWRVQQVLKMGAIEGQQLLSANDWEAVKRRGESAIREWIDKHMSGKSCLVVLAGAATANRKWVNYEIDKAWSDGKGVVAVYIHGLENRDGRQDSKGGNPLSYVTTGSARISSLAKDYDTPYSSSKFVYQHIDENLEGWIDEAIQIRKRY
jgi:macrodomain Ter protein organizer (MatP/YcbG family)